MSEDADELWKKVKCSPHTHLDQKAQIEIWKELMSSIYSVKVQLAMFDLLIGHNFFPKADYRPFYLLQAMSLIDSEFYGYKFKIFDKLTARQKILIKYLVRYYKHQIREYHFEPDESYGSRKQRLEQGLSNEQGAFLTYACLQQFCL